ncbi:hypothetical protein N0V82_001271 [Gnomoniopsis sp. IMI 355080]|nr:hypothetical protein N0V82_001271 [Gnomoniopsis sp. IMI 355080]
MDQVKETVVQVKDMLELSINEELSAPHERKDDEDVLYGKNGAGTKAPEQPYIETIKSPLAQGHIQDDEPKGESDVPTISAPADVTGMTGQYVTGRDPSPSADQ